MSKQLPPTLEGLHAANPVRSDDNLGRSPEAQETLRRILAEARDSVPHRRRRAAGRRLAVVLAVMLVGAASSVAATDPFGWWKSQNPQTALYRPDPGRAVRPPTLGAVRCQHVSGGAFRCGVRMAGRPYVLVDNIPAAPATNPFSRARILDAVAHALQSGRISTAVAQHIRTDLARVSDSFLATLYDPRGGGSYGLNQPDSGVSFVPPAGVPAFLACRTDRQMLDCQNLNGDEQVPTGTGVYMAERTTDWRAAPPARRNPTAPARPQPTAAQAALLNDVLTYLMTARATTG